MKQNGACETKIKNYNFYSFASMHTKYISVESAILGQRENIRVYSLARLFIKLGWYDAKIASKRKKK